MHPPGQEMLRQTNILRMHNNEIHQDVNLKSNFGIILFLRERVRTEMKWKRNSIKAIYE